MWYIQDDSGGNVNIFGDYSVKVRMNMHLILNGYLFTCLDLHTNSFRIYFVGLNAERSLHKQTNKDGHTQDELSARILHSANHTKKREDQHRRKTRAL